jgi:thiol:disulfide interchange protein DsbC
MTKSVLQCCIVLSALLLTVAPNAGAEGDSEELEQVRARVSGLFSEIEPENVMVGPIDGWYTIRKGAIVAYISKDGRYLLQGDLIDLEKQVNLTEESRDQARREMLSALPENQMIIFSPEEVKYSISVFTDVDCSYCRRLHSQINDYLGEGIQVRYLLYPRNGPKSQSWVKAERVWCSDDRNEALTLAKLDKEFESHNCDASIVSNHYVLGQDVGLQGTPAIVFENGQLISGYVPAKRLSEQLESVSQQDKGAL